MGGKSRPLSELLAMAERQEQLDAEARRVARDSGRMLREARLSAGVSTSALASAAGVTTPYLYSVENGNRAISPKQVRRFGSLLEALEQEVADGDKDEGEGSEAG